MYVSIYIYVQLGAVHLLLVFFKAGRTRPPCMTTACGACCSARSCAACPCAAPATIRVVGATVLQLLLQSATLLGVGCAALLFGDGELAGRLLADGNLAGASRAVTEDPDDAAFLTATCGRLRLPAALHGSANLVATVVFACALIGPDDLAAKSRQGVFLAADEALNFRSACFRRFMGAWSHSRRHSCAQSSAWRRLTRPSSVPFAADNICANAASCAARCALEVAAWV